MVKSLEARAPLTRRIIVPVNGAFTPAEIAEMNRAPWLQAGKYGLAWTYFAFALLFLASAIRFYHIWGDKIRIALHKEDRSSPLPNAAQQGESELPSAATEKSTTQFFPQRRIHHHSRHSQSSVSTISTIAPLNNTIAFFRWLFYRPIPVWRVGSFQIVFPSLGVSAVVLASLIFVTLYSFVPQPLYFSSIELGSPPLAIRSGMLALAMVPWIVALSTKANVLSLLTGLGHERLNVVHRWAGYICLFLSLIHTIPFFITPIWVDGAVRNYKLLPRNIYIYGTGLSCLAPLVFLCIHSLPSLRKRAYELFVFFHLPIAIFFVAMLFWHTRNALATWTYLWITVAIWVGSSCVRVWFLNWSNPFRMSFLIGEESALTILPEDAIKVTVPTQLRWRPGQYVYLRMPGISLLGNHPFTIASLCSDDFPSQYGEDYRDLALVFRPFRGFTRQVYKKALEQPYKTHTAFLEGPYGGMQREMAAFDDVIFVAGGSGITAIASQLLNLIKKMRDGKALTKSVRIIWALKTPDTMEWFKEELRICRDYAPPNTVHCYFFLTGPRPDLDASTPEGGSSAPRTPKSQPAGRDIVQEKINDMLQEIDKRNSAFLREAAADNEQRENDKLRRRPDDAISPLPQAYTISRIPGSIRHAFYTNPPHAELYTGVSYTGDLSPQPSTLRAAVPFDFGFQPSSQEAQPAPPSASLQGTPTPQFAHLPTGRREGWRTDYVRPDIPRMLQQFLQTFGRRTCVFVCGPPSMRVEVARTVARLQGLVLTDPTKDEIFLHAENYGI